ncbi:hypothetical protein [Kribbella deserti]|uniref:Peptidase inhibitor family I36 protein n=1 Tax=Kribbella deserti TaxID=1926257 RepID=A0ABV6QLP0_9ACTN
MTITRKFAATLAGSAALFAGIIGNSAVTTQPAVAKATAAHYNGICEPSDVCLYRGGSLLVDLPATAGGQCRGVNPYYDHMWNRSVVAQRAWSGTNCTGRIVDVPSGGSQPINAFYSVGYAG